MPMQWVPPSRADPENCEITGFRHPDPQSKRPRTSRARILIRRQRGDQPPGASDHLRVARALAVGPQVAVEDHRDGPHQHAAGRQHGDPLVVDLQRAALLPSPADRRVRRRNILKSIRCAISMDSTDSSKWHISAWMIARRRSSASARCRATPAGARCRGCRSTRRGS